MRGPRRRPGATRCASICPTATGTCCGSPSASTSARPARVPGRRDECFGGPGDRPHRRARRSRRGVGRDHPPVAVAAVIAVLAAVAALGFVFRRWPNLFVLTALLTLPLRIPLDIG